MFSSIFRYKDFDYTSNFWNCHRDDERNLIDEWQAMNPSGKLLMNKTQMMEESTMASDKLLGIFLENLKGLWVKRRVLVI